MDRAAQCPLCGEANECGAAAGTGTCWCRSAAAVPEEVIARVPEELRGAVCVCERCAQDPRGRAQPSPIEPTANRD